MKTLMLLLIMMSVGWGLNAQSFDTETRTIVKDFKFCNNEVRFDFDQNITVKTWDRKGVRFLVEVRLESHRTGLIKELAKMGRYQVQLEENGTLCVFSIPESHKLVEINGVALKEAIHVTVYVPNGAENYLFPEGQISYNWQ